MIKQSSILSIYSKFMVLAVLFLISAGALVTSHDAGLAVPDWPTTFGQGMFQFPFEQWRGGVFYEHGHRVIASCIGALTLLYAVLIFCFEKKRAWVRKLGLAAVTIVLIQGMLGGLTVLLRLPALVSSAHAVLGQTFLLVLIVLAYSFSKLYSRVEEEVTTSSHSYRKVFYIFLLFASLVYIQLIIAAFMRHTGSGLAVLDFPLHGNSVIPDFSVAWLETINAERLRLGLSAVTIFQTSIHILHRMVAYAIACAVLGVVLSVVREKVVMKPVKYVSYCLVLIVFLQIILGISALLLKREPMITSVHVVTGAVLLGLSVLLATTSYHSLRKSQAL